MKLLRRCLTKDRKQRLQDIGDARLELDQAILELGNPSLGFAPPVLDSSQLKRSRTQRIVGAAIRQHNPDVHIIAIMQSFT